MKVDAQLITAACILALVVTITVVVSNVIINEVQKYTVTTTFTIAKKYEGYIRKEYALFPFNYFAAQEKAWFFETHDGTPYVVNQTEYSIYNVGDIYTWNPPSIMVN